MEFSFKNAEELFEYCYAKNCDKCWYRRICLYWKKHDIDYDDPRIFEGLRNHFRKEKLKKLLS